jgi:hypothetical protein
MSLLRIGLALCFILGGLAVIVPTRAQTGLTTVCQFNTGPRAGTSLDFHAYGVQPIPIGSPCTDGRGSSGVAIAGGNQSAGPSTGSANLTTLCRFTSGPKAGSVVDYKTYGVQPVAVGSQCTDGADSYGTAIAGSTAAGRASASPRPSSDSYGACRNNCQAARDQCIDSCGPGPDHVNNPNWLSCRHSCRDTAQMCRSSCPDAGSSDSDSDK